MVYCLNFLPLEGGGLRWGWSAKNFTPILPSPCKGEGRMGVDSLLDAGIRQHDGKDTLKEKEIREMKKKKTGSTGNDFCGYDSTVNFTITGS